MVLRAGSLQRRGDPTPAVLVEQDSNRAPGSQQLRPQRSRVSAETRLSKNENKRAATSHEVSAAASLLATWRHP